MFGLTDCELSILRGALQKYRSITEVKIFGSRAEGNYRPNSDIDLSVWGDVDELELSMIEMELNELPLPYQIDMKLYSSIVNEQLREHIDRKAIQILPQ